jgi:hypothetical protein
MSTQQKIQNHLWTKYCLSNDLYCPFLTVQEELEFIPAIYRTMYLRVFNATMEDMRLLDLQVIAECERDGYY